MVKGWHFERVAGGQGPATGVTWNGRSILFALPDEALVRSYTPATGAVAEFRRYTGRVNGLAAARDGSVYAAQESSRRVIELLPDGSASVTATRFEGSVHNFPAGVAVDPQGRIWFCDSATGVQVFGPRIFPLLEPAAVMRIERDDRRNWVMRRMTADTVAPRGVALAPDGRTIYVAEGEAGRRGPREVRAYPVQSDGALGPYRVLHRFTEDHTGVHRGAEGVCVDGGGRVIACAGAPGVGPGAALYVFDASGLLREVHPFAPAAPMACVVADGVVYATAADGGLYRAAPG